MDYDVKAASLASPPASAPVQSYRPAVAVQNLGIHTATVTGNLRIYDRDAGTLLYTMLLTETEVPVGETRNALADQLWEPTAGDINKAFLFIATVDYPPDQYLPNNNLGPITVIVTAAPPPPPPPVPAHAAQHENDGGDEIDVEGLTGKLAEPQTPSAHASDHQADGADQVDVTGLSGELADPQTAKAHHTSHEPGGADEVTGLTPSAHATTHENGGDDELSIAGLSGLAADPQAPTDHAEQHEHGGGDELSVQELSGVLSDPQIPQAHGSTVHDATVEATANKDAASGYAPLSTERRIPWRNAAARTLQLLGTDQTETPLTVGETFQVLTFTIIGPTTEAFYALIVSASFIIEHSGADDIQTEAKLSLIGHAGSGVEAFSPIFPTSKHPIPADTSKASVTLKWLFTVTDQQSQFSAKLYVRTASGTAAIFTSRHIDLTGTPRNA